MHQAPAATWNKVARMGLETTWAARLFPMAPEEMDRALAAEETRLTEAGTPAPVASAFLMVAPLLWEREAIGAADVDLPNVVDVAEAVRLASLEFSLTDPQRQQLRQLLQAPPA